ncbi:MAG: PAS domain-containing protein [Stellaceae bacterium]
MGDFADRALAHDEVLSALLAYWRSKLAGRAMPRRADIDPAEIPRLLPNLQLVERVGGRFRYRLAGTAIVAAYGSELTGKFVDEIIPAGRRAIAERHYTMVYESRRPIFVRNKYTTTRAVDIVATRVILPLSEDGTGVSMVVMGQTFEYGTELRATLGGDAVLAPYAGVTEFL